MPLTSWSMTKTVTGILVGMLAGEGRIDVFGPAPVPEWQGGGDPRAAITVDQLMRMSSGLAFLEEYGATPSDVVIMLHEKASTGSYAASFPLEAEPDSRWYYSSGTTNILSRIVRDAIGGDLESYVRFPRERLFDKLGMQTPVMELDPLGVFVGSSFMYATPRDWARMGLFLMQDGVWNGEAILPADWMTYMKTPTAGAPKGEYGAQLWLNSGNAENPDVRDFPDAPRDVFYLSGFEGQRVIAVPSHNAVIVRMGLTPDGSAMDYNELVKRVVVALPAD
jgi:CubicO group peptidase (beta-lactamase class C family)